MRARELAVAGAIEFTAASYPDERGVVAVPFRLDDFVAACGTPLFRVAQTVHSSSRRGVARGMHYTVTPPGMAKYVYCAAGRARYAVADVRVGSPTFGRGDHVDMGPEKMRSLYIPVGTANGFVALEEHTVVSYMLSTTYSAHDERALAMLDPALGLVLPEDLDLVRSDRDRCAPTLAQARHADALPIYEQCLALERRRAASPGQG